MTIRVFYEKTGRAKYISHLDLVRCMTRVVARSELPVWYTQGFNPHIYLTFAQPLSLGMESLCETMDFKLEQEVSMETVVESLNRCVPEGIRILRAASPQMKTEAIAWADYTAKIFVEGDREALGWQFQRFCEGESIPVMKKTKKGPKEIDIKPFLRLEGWENGADCLILRMMLCAGTTFNVNPTLLLEAFREQAGIVYEHVAVCKNAVLTEDFAPFC